MRGLGCVLLTAAGMAHAGPPAGTTIPNTASGSAQIGAQTQSAGSNTVSATVGSTPVVSGFAAMLANNNSIVSQLGAVVTQRHTLTNIGTTADTYTLAVADTSTGLTFASLQLFADANDDGQSDSSTPLAAPIALAPGQVFHFVARYVLPESGPARETGTARIGATAASGAPIAPVLDRVMVLNVNTDCSIAGKWLSQEAGPSPGGPVTVTLTYNSCDRARSRLTIVDRLPPGMTYVPGSGRWSRAGETPLTDANASDLQGAGTSQIAYDFGVSVPGAVSATIHTLPAQDGGNLTFQVRIDPGLDAGSIIPNTAQYAFAEGNGAGNERNTNTATYRVTGRIVVDLVGQHLATVAPGSTAVFENVLTNRGTVTETFDITLGGSTFPSGTTFALFNGDGVTPLSDSSGNNVPDTGPVAPGGTYKIVVRAAIPASATPGAYKVTKTARSVSAPAVSASDDDVVDTIQTKCAVGIDPDHQANVGFGQRVTYAHFITNHGNCTETLRAMLEYLRDGTPGWTSSAYVDNAAAGGASIAGVVDPTDTPIRQGWTTTIAPGATLRILVEVVGPTSREALAAAKANAKAAKDTLGSNITTLSIANSTAAGGALTVRDTTYLDDGTAPPHPHNAIQNYTDGSYTSTTPWGVIGGNLWLRADAASCNASPTVAETRTVVITGPNGEREEVAATETGPDTGIFAIPAMPVRSPPVVAMNKILQGEAGQVFDVDLPGCGTRISTLVTLMSPSSVVFDSASNEPVAGAGVTLVSASGGACTSAPVSLGGASNPVTTGADGRFVFAEVPAGSYCVTVRPPNGHRAPSQVPWMQLPAGRNLVVSGPTQGASYGSAFTVAAGAPFVVDVPVDAIAQDGLFVQKNASRPFAEVGEMVDYVVRVSNNTGNPLERAPVVLADELPRGFAFVAGTARRDDKPLPDPPASGQSTRFELPIGPMARGEVARIAYRVRVGPGALQGDGINRVQAIYAASGATTRSNTATARVRVAGGVLGDRAFILGRVWMDCDANGTQQAGERGVPGVRVLLEDGTFVLTDGEGKFSFYGIPNRTHVVKVDATTLPLGAALAAVSSRHLGDGASRIVDLKAGELHRADFAVAGCAPGLLKQVEERAKAAALADELSIAQAQLATVPQVVSDVKALPASGTVTLQNVPVSRDSPGPDRPSPAPRITTDPVSTAVAPAQAPLEDLLPGLDSKLGFIGLADGATLPYAQSTIRVKGTAGSTLRLAVNGSVVDEKQVGKRAVYAEKQVQGWEYIGVDLKAGRNSLVVSQVDSFGNPRGEVSIDVVAPGRLGRVEIAAPPAIADGKTPARIYVRVSDAAGVPVTSRTPVTLEASRGKWMVEDADPLQPGIQAFVEGGTGEFSLLPPMEPGDARVTVESGGFKADARLDFLPELRSLVAAGVIEGIVNLRNGAAVVPAGASDGFEQEIKHLSRTWDDGKGAAGARAAFYLKGKVRGDYLLTAAYDSDKDSRERLFRDIQPDEFYPVYGDSGVRGYDAQSTSKLYVRIDKDRSYLLYGDFTTTASGDVRKLANYNRSLTGARWHYETSRVMVDAFASRDTSRQAIEEIRANGTSGPFQLGTRGGLLNSEKVEIVTRDRNQPALILGTVPQTRFVDYEIDSFTGRIVFRAPIPSLDSNLNPVLIRVTYEVDQGGDAFWAVGVDGQVRVHDRVQVGATYVKDRNPLVPFTLAGANLTVRVGESTFVILEGARTERGLDGTTGNAGRIEVKHESQGVRVHAYAARTDESFDNPGSYLTQGRGEAGARVDYKISETTSILGEALRTEDVKTGAVRDGLAASLQYRLDKQLTLELGVRHAAEKNNTTSPIPPVQGQPAPQPMPDEVTTVRARLTAGVPFIQGASVYGEAEFDVKDADRKVIALGGEYPFLPKSRIYARHELISSITGPYGLNQNERQNTTAVGVDTEYMRDGRLFSEYRIRDAISGGDAEAAFGLRNLWSLAPGLRMGTTLERVHALSGTGQNENTAGSVALEYTGSPIWKGTTRVEARQGQAQESLLFTVGLAARLAQDWTVLARNSWDITRNRIEPGEREIERLQAGLAYRDSTTNRVNALARVEHRLESDTTQPGMHLRIATDLVSINADWQLNRPFLVSGRYAARWTSDKSLGLSTKAHAQVAGARATWEFAPRWDVSFVASVLAGSPGDARQYAAGVELGYLIATNLWVSAGYNFSGYKDAELAGGDQTAKGAYVRMRYKFDEAVLPEAWKR